MSLDMAIAHGKEWRRTGKLQGRKAKNADPTCRNHGHCPACAKKRKYKLKRQLPLEDKEDADG